MPLGEHLAELRGRLVISLLAIVIAGIVGIIWYEPIVHFLYKPACNIPGIQGVGEGECKVLTSKGLLGPFSLVLKVALLSGLIIASPVWIYQLWAFVAPGLHRRERRWTLAFVAVAVPFFLAGAAAAYYTLPRGVPILLQLAPSGVSNDVDLADYLDIVMRLILVFGLAFELPILLVALNLVGVLSAARLWSWWRMAFMLIFLFAAVATPTGDPLTMSLLALPMCALYLAAAVIATIVDRRRAGQGEFVEGLSDDEASPVARPVELDELARREPGPAEPPDDIT
jgi:sec-independent protein translocase protein TatC